MKTVCLSLLVSLLLFCCGNQKATKKPELLAETDFNPDQLQEWNVNVPQNWTSIDTGGQSLYQLRPDIEPTYSIRRPRHTAVWSPHKVKNFKLVVKARSMAEASNPKRDICLYFGYQDSLHFYYAHFSMTSDQVHNIIGMVNYAPRQKINLEAVGKVPGRLEVGTWHTLSVLRNSDTGWIKAYIDDLETPVMTAKDTTFSSGYIGIGSFDDEVDFEQIKLYTF